MQVNGERYLNEKQVAELTGLSLSKIRVDRHKGKGIPYVRISSRCVRYRESDVHEFMNKHLIQTEN